MKLRSTRWACNACSPFAPHGLFPHQRPLFPKVACLTTTSRHHQRHPPGHWQSQENRRLFFESVGATLNLNRAEEWYNVDLKTIQSHGGTLLMKRHYNQSIMRALQDVFPHHTWLPWKFAKVPAGYWETKAHKVQFVHWLEQQLKIHNLTDWYAVPTRTVNEYGGAGLLVNDYGGSLFGLLNDVYSTHIWRPWLFDTCPQNYWESMSNQREYFDWLAEQFGVASLDDWYTIRPSAIRTSHAVSLLSRYYENSISKALFAIYPSHPWESSKFNVTLQEPSP